MEHLCIKWAFSDLKKCKKNFVWLAWMHMSKSYLNNTDSVPMFSFCWLAEEMKNWVNNCHFKIIVSTVIKSSCYLFLNFCSFMTFKCTVYSCVFSIKFSFSFCIFQYKGPITNDVSSESGGGGGEGLVDINHDAFWKEKPKFRKTIIEIWTTFDFLGLKF